VIFGTKTAKHFFFQKSETFSKQCLYLTMARFPAVVRDAVFDPLAQGTGGHTTASLAYKQAMTYM